MARFYNSKGRSEAAAIRRSQALELRTKGWAYRAIGPELGISHGQAVKDVQRALAEIAKVEHEKAGELRIIELERLDLAAKAIEPKVTAGDPRATEVWIRLGESRRKLLGLDARTTATNLNIDMGQCTEEQLERMANGEDPIVVLANSKE